jgi:poly(A) polymerase
MSDSTRARRVYHQVSADRIDPDVVKIVRRLRRFEHDAYLVGGCVRDLLLGARPKDFDVATCALPTEVRRLFRNSRVIGRRFKLVHVFFRGGKVIEVATFRQPPEGVQGDGEDLLITDDNVFGDAEDDAFRRDFTINALFFDLHSREIVDYVDGLADVETRTVRSIGDPDVRLREDPVRMLRAVKFASRLDLTIEPGLWDAIRRHAEELQKSAVPRLLEEIYRIFRPGCGVAAFGLLRSSGLFAQLMPGVDRWIEAGPAGEDREAELVSVIRGLDGAVADRGEDPPDSLVLATLLWPSWSGALREVVEALPEGRQPDLGNLSLGFVPPILTRLRVPRRIQDRVRQLLVAQQRFEPGRRRRRSQEAFQRRSYFEDALDLLEVRLRGQGASLQPVNDWRSNSGLGPLEPPEPKKRKRRRRRRRRSGGEGAKSSATKPG